MWRSMRSGSVSMPCRISQAVCGLMRGAEVAQALAPGAQQEGADGDSSLNTMLWKPS
jgi:hypothetical protein